MTLPSLLAHSTTTLTWAAIGLAGSVGSFLVAQIPDSPVSGTAVGIGAGAAIGTAVGTAASMIIAAIGVNFFRPWLESRGLKGQVDALSAEVAKFRADLAARDALLASKESQVVAIEAANRNLVAKLTDLTDKNLRIAGIYLAQAGRIKVMADRVPILIADHQPAPDGPRVLVVEDEDDVRTALVDMLHLLRCRATGVGTVAEAMAALDAPEADRPEVIVLDLMLPRDADGRSDGVAVLRRVRQAGLPIRVVVATGKDPGLLAEVRSLGPAAILPKPYDFMADLMPHVLGAPTP